LGEARSIAAVVPLPGRRSRFEVQIPGMDPLTVHEDVVVALGLGSGTPVTDDLLASIEHHQSLAEAFHAALRLLRTRSRSRRELVAALGRRGFTGRVMDDALAKLDNLGLVNDQLTARDLAHSLLRRHPYGRQGLLYRLRERGLDSGVVEGAVAEATEGADEAGRAEHALRQRLPRWASLPADARRAKAWRFLAQLGYDSDAISEALEAALADD